MLKKLTVWLLIFSVTVSNFSTAIVFVGFKLNQQYIAANLCVNRDKPGLHCNGKCYFMKKIRQAEEKEKNTENHSLKYKFQETVLRLSTDVRFHTCLLQTIDTPYICSILPVPTNTIFRPPQIG